MLEKERDRRVDGMIAKGEESFPDKAGCVSPWDPSKVMVEANILESFPSGVSPL